MPDPSPPPPSTLCTADRNDLLHALVRAGLVGDRYARIIAALEAAGLRGLERPPPKAEPSSTDPPR